MIYSKIKSAAVNVKLEQNMKFDKIPYTGPSDVTSDINLEICSITYAKCWEIYTLKPKKQQNLCQCLDKSEILRKFVN